MKNFILFLLIAFSINAQNIWKNYTYTNNITAIEKTGDVWWIGTLGGLVKFNDSNHKVEIFNRGNSNILSNHIYGLAADENNNIWIATYYGLSKFDDTDFTNYDSSNSGLISNHIKLVEFEKNKGVWVVTDSALTFFDGINWINYRKDNEGNELNKITSIFPASPNGILYGTSDSQVKFLHHDGSFGDMQFPGNAYWGVTSVIYDVYNNVVVSDNDGFWTNKNNIWTHFDQYNSPLPISSIYKMEIDPSGSGDIYFGLYQHGIAVLHLDDTWNIIPDIDGDDLNYLSTFFVGDKIGLGLSQMSDGFIIGEHPSEWKYNFSDRYNISTSPIHSNEVQNIKIINDTKYISSTGVDVLGGNNNLISTYNENNLVGKYLDVDSFGRIWISDGYNPYVVKIENGQETLLNSDSLGLGIAIANIGAIQYEKDPNAPANVYGKLWMSTRSTDYEGIVWLDSADWHSFPNSHPEYPWSFEEFVEDNNGIKWFAGMDGIYSYDGDNFNSHWDDSPIKQASCVVKDKQGNIWFGGIPSESFGFQGGLAKYNGSSWTLYNSSNSDLPDNSVTSLAIDTLGNIFVGTMNGGLSVIDQNFQWKNFSRENSPLDNNFIKKITVDRANNNIWILNNEAGIFIYNHEGIVSVQNILSEMPLDFKLYQNYPNPFNPSTTINYLLPEGGNVTLKIYDILGQEVTTLVNKKQSAGKYKVKFDAGNLSSGIYFYRLIADNFWKTKKMILLK